MKHIQEIGKKFQNFYQARIKVHVKRGINFWRRNS